MADRRTTNLLGAVSLGIHELVSRAAEDAVGSGGATAAAVLHLEREPGSSIEALARAVGLSHPGAVRLVDRLEDAELVERWAGADARSVAVVLTRRGRRAAVRIRVARARVLDAVLAGVPASRSRAARELLEQLAAALAEQLPVGSHDAIACRLCDRDVCPASRCPLATE